MSSIENPEEDIRQNNPDRSFVGIAAGSASKLHDYINIIGGDSSAIEGPIQAARAEDATVEDSSRAKELLAGRLKNFEKGLAQIRKDLGGSVLPEATPALEEAQAALDDLAEAVRRSLEDSSVSVQAPFNNFKRRIFMLAGNLRSAAKKF